MSQDLRVLRNTARAIKIAYLNKRKIQNPYFKLSQKWSAQQIWERIAEVVLKNNAEPEEWVEAAFFNCKVVGGPYPNSLYGKAALKWWEDWKGKTDEKSFVEKLVDSDMAFALDRIDVALKNGVTDAYKNVLSSTISGIPAYVRYMLTAAHAPEIAETVREEFLEFYRASATFANLIETKYANLRPKDSTSWNR